MGLSKSVIIGVISPLSGVILINLLRTLLTKSHEPLSRVVGLQGLRLKGFESCGVQLEHVDVALHP